MLDDDNNHGDALRLLCEVVFFCCTWHVVGVLSGRVFAQSSEAVEDLNRFLFNLSFMETH